MRQEDVTDYNVRLYTDYIQLPKCFQTFCEHRRVFH